VKNWTHDIIENLRENYSETHTELNRFIIDRFGIKADDLTKAGKIAEILNDYDKKGYLNWKVGKITPTHEGEFEYEWDEGLKPHEEAAMGAYPDSYMGFKGYKKYFGTTFKGQDLNLKDYRVEAKLTIEGLDYAIELKREKVKYWFLLATGVLSTIFALTAAVMSIANFKKKSDIPLAPPAQVILLPTQQISPTTLPDTSKKTIQHLLQSPDKKILSASAKH